MKQILLSFFALFLLGQANAQVLLDEDFQVITDMDVVEVLEDLFDNPTVWGLIDSDGQPETGGDPSIWLWATGPEHTFVDGTTEALIPLDGVEDTSPNGIVYPWMNSDGIEDTNAVFLSSSWMANAAIVNMDYMILPEMELTGNAVFSFKASTGQGPRYSDGFAVLVATEGFDEIESYTEVFRVAECVQPVPSSATTGADALDLSQGTVFHAPEGAYIPYNGFDTTAYLGTYFHLGGQAYDDASSFRGLLEPFSVDLSEFAGENVRIAILHDSEDDVSISVDDLLVEQTVGIEESYTEYFSIYPNPVADDLNLQFTEKLTGIGMIRVIDANGRLVQSAAFRSNGNAELRSIDVANLATGQYSLQLLRDGEKPVFTSFVKN